MVTHIVLLKLKRSSALTAGEVAQLLESMDGRVPQIRELETGVDALRSARSYDVSLVVRFQDWADAEGYQGHPAHREVLGRLQPNLESTAVVDYES